MTATLPTTSEFIKKYGLDAKKSLGQNFILDKNFTDKIAKSAIDDGKNDLSDEVILEIGPGPASLTRSILDLNPDKLIVVEKDPRCIEILQEIQEFYGSDKLEIHNLDAIKIDELEILNLKKDQKFKIIANLPYNIGTLLIIKWLRIAKNISSMTLMLQKEVAQRICAQNTDNNYGRISILTQNFAKAKISFDVSKTVFTPPPKVTSAIIKISPYEKPLFDIDVKLLGEITFAAFSQRRKMIRSSLKNLEFKDEKTLEAVLQELSISSTLRAENLSLQNFCDILARCK